MGLIQAIINFIKRLLGIQDPRANQAALEAARASAVSTEDEAGEDGGDDEHYAVGEWRRMQALVATVEATGSLDLAGVDPRDPVTFYVKLFAIEQAQADGQTREQALAAHGLGGDDHWEQLSAYIYAKWSELGEDEDGEPTIRQLDAFTNAALKARHAQLADAQAQAAAADPNLLAPVEGVSVDDWAAASAAIGQGGDATAMLARYGMDAAKWDRVNAGWQAKMQGDTTMVIATKFGDAFGKATGALGGAGGAPCSFERFVEIMAAQEAWAQRGMDVNAQLRAVFGISAADYGGYSTYWAPKMALDVAMMREYEALRERFLAKYKGAGLDDDLTL